MSLLTPEQRELRRVARRATKDAIRRGEIRRPGSCKRCRKRRRLEAHHQDYRRPLDILWLCADCHKKAHGWRTLRERRADRGRLVILTAEAASLARLAESPATIPEIARESGRTIAGIRAALFRLSEQGLARRKAGDPEGVTHGRPPDLWSLTVRGRSEFSRHFRQVQEVYGFGESA